MMDASHAESTRYLCAASYLDVRLRRWLHDNVIDDEHHAIGRPVGVDLPTVVKHCLMAERRQFRCEVALGVLAMALVYIVVATPDARRLIGLQAASTWPHPAANLVTPILVLLLALGWAVVGIDRFDQTFRVLGRNLALSTFRPAVDIAVPADLEKRLATASDDPANNVVVYRGYAPFVGAGVNVGGWSFALNINKPKDDAAALLRSALGVDIPAVDLAPQPRSTHLFDVRDLYIDVEEAVVRLDLPGVSIRDRLYVSGRTIRSDPRFLDNPLARPRTSIDSALMTPFIGELARQIRHYKCIEVNTWDGELVLSIFLRFAKVEQSLFIETSYYLLTPVHAGYRKVDGIPSHPSWRQWLPLILQSAIAGPLLMLVSPFLLLGRLLGMWMHWQQRREQRRTVADDPSFDYGAETSVRDFARSNGYHQYFQQLDKEMYVKIIERQVLDAAVDFLDRHNIDTSDLRQRQTTILNNGVVVTGGSVNAESLAVGARSTATNSAQRPVPPQAAATRE